MDNVRGLKVEEIVERLSEQLMPLLDRSNRMLLRNLKALRALKQPPAPSVSIGQAGQVNVAHRQVKAAAAPPTSSDLEPPPTPCQSCWGGERGPKYLPLYLVSSVADLAPRRKLGSSQRGRQPCN